MVGAASEHRVLVVEDEVLLAMDIESILSTNGWIVLGPVGSIAEALQFIGSNGIDIALLDINLAGEKSFLIADALDEAGVPFIVVTGHSRAMLPLEHRERPFLQKPYQPAELLSVMKELMESRRGSH